MKRSEPNHVCVLTEQPGLFEFHRIGLGQNQFAPCPIGAPHADKCYPTVGSMCFHEHASSGCVRENALLGGINLCCNPFGARTVAPHEAQTHVCRSGLLSRCWNALSVSKAAPQTAPSVPSGKTQGRPRRIRRLLASVLKRTFGGWGWGGGVGFLPQQGGRGGEGGLHTSEFSQ